METPPWFKDLFEARTLKRRRAAEARFLSSISDGFRPGLDKLIRDRDWSTTWEDAEMESVRRDAWGRWKWDIVRLHGRLAFVAKIRLREHEGFAVDPTLIEQSHRAAAEFVGISPADFTAAAVVFEESQEARDLIVEHWRGKMRLASFF